MKREPKQQTTAEVSRHLSVCILLDSGVFCNISFFSSVLFSFPRFFFCCCFFQTLAALLAEGYIRNQLSPSAAVVFGIRIWMPVKQSIWLLLDCPYASVHRLLHTAPCEQHHKSAVRAASAGTEREIEDGEKARGRESWKKGRGFHSVKERVKRGRGGGDWEKQRWG